MAFRLLEGRQRPAETADLYLLSGIISGMLAKASHDLGSPHAAMSQARAAIICAENAGHDGLRTWVRVLQSVIAYWAGSPHEAARYVDAGVEYAARTRSSAAVWLPAQAARVWGVLGDAERVSEAIAQAEYAREQTQPDELDDFGGIMTFTQPRQLYYAADARVWLSGEERLAADSASAAIDAYAHAGESEQSFSDEAGARADLALARIHLGDLDGAAEAMAGVPAFPLTSGSAGSSPARDASTRRCARRTSAAATWPPTSRRRSRTSPDCPSRPRCRAASRVGGMYPVSLSSARLALREFTPADAEPLLAVYGDPRVAEHMSFEPRNREQIEATIAGVTKAAQVDPRTEYSLAAVLPDGELVAFARLAIDVGHPLQNSAQLGFALRADRWRQGLGTEVVRLLLRLGFEHLGVYRIWGARSPRNGASAAVMTKLGMIEEGVIRGHLKLATGWRDSVVHSILVPEWKALQG
ncbi:GNAT family N-acetyltransferase [Nonomuraea sp. NPDC050783]|uniref:GNAT family N-acetyltransferase n=1 Tax=Nonomuraea sp. NPDC050783 TaxID=3154634 RepID=UPI003464ED1D